MSNNLIIDMSNLLYRTFFANIKEQSEIVVGLCYVSALNCLAEYRNKFKANKVFLVFDAHCWRKDYTASDKCKSFKKYKGNRRQKLTTSEQEKLDIFDQHVDDFFDILANNTSLTVLRQDGLEADDIISGLVNVYDDCTNIIVSSDKDFMQLIRPNVILFDPVSKKTRNLSEYNNDPQYFLFHKCIRGDDGDNVMSAYPRVRSTAIEKAYGDEFERVKLMKHDFKVMAQDSKTGDYKELSYITEDVFKENRLLMDLNAQPKYVKKLIYTTIESALQETGKFNYFKFMRFCKKNNLINILDRIDYYVPLLSGK